MSVKLAGSLTEKNLALAFIGESMARNRYTFFSDVAKKQGFEQVAAIFRETAENEAEHARYFWSKLPKGSGSVKVEASVPSCGVNDTVENLKNAAAGEFEEHTKEYPHMADVADKEGFKDIAKAFRNIASVEKEHEERFKTLAKLVESKTYFKRSETYSWKCRNCGYVVRSNLAPKACPVCFKPQGWFEIKEILE